MSLENLSNDQQFHSFALLRCRDHKAIDSQRMLTHFGVPTLIESIAKSSNERRADILQKCTGIKRNSALKMGVAETISMIQVALAEGDTTAAEIFDEENGGISTEEIVRFFPLDQVFDLWFHSGFITAETKEDKAFMADLYDFISQHQMFGPMTSLELVQQIGIQHFVSDKCPIEKRTKLLEKVLQFGDPALVSTRTDASSMNAGKTKGFASSHLLETITPTDLVGFIPLAHLSKPIYALAKAKGWMKTKGAQIPEGALDSVSPPAPDSMTSGNDGAASGQAESDEDILARLEAEERAKQERGEGGDEGNPADVVVIDTDDEDPATSDGSGVQSAKPPPLKKDKRSARAGG